MIVNKKQFYNFYQRLGVENALDEAVFKKLLERILECVLKDLLRGEMVEISKTGGYLMIRGRRLRVGELEGTRKGFPVNWKATYDKWESDKQAFIDGIKVYWQNSHTDQICYGLKWFKEKYFVPNKKYYRFHSSKIVRDAIHLNANQGKKYQIKETKR